MKTDFFGTAVDIGDEIAFNPPTYKGLRKGKIVSFTLKGFRIEYRGFDKHLYITTAFEIIKKP